MDQPILADQILSGDLSGIEVMPAEQVSCSFPSSVFPSSVVPSDSLPSPQHPAPAHLFQRGQSGHPGRAVRSADEKESAGR